VLSFVSVSLPVSVRLLTVLTVDVTLAVSPPGVELLVALDVMSVAVPVSLVLLPVTLIWVCVALPV
jgi:hypothetical protein